MTVHVGACAPAWVWPLWCPGVLVSGVGGGRACGGGGLFPYPMAFDRALQSSKDPLPSALCVLLRCALSEAVSGVVPRPLANPLVHYRYRCVTVTTGPLSLPHLAGQGPGCTDPHGSPAPRRFAICGASISVPAPVLHAQRMWSPGKLRTSLPVRDHAAPQRPPLALPCYLFGLLLAEAAAPHPVCPQNTPPPPTRPTTGWSSHDPSG